MNINHPSFGLLTSDYRESEAPLFAVHTPTARTFILRLSSAALLADGDEEMVVEGAHIVSVELSMAQLASVLSGGGQTTPCTIRERNGLKVEDPFEDRRRERIFSNFSQALAESTADFKARARQFVLDLQDGAPSKTRRTEMGEYLEGAIGGMEFLAHRLAELAAQHVDELLKEVPSDYRSKPEQKFSPNPLTARIE